MTRILQQTLLEEEEASNSHESCTQTMAALILVLVKVSISYMSALMNIVVVFSLHTAVFAHPELIAGTKIWAFACLSLYMVQLNIIAELFSSMSSAQVSFSCCTG
jgi:hypothetical protein